MLDIIVSIANLTDVPYNLPSPVFLGKKRMKEIGISTAAAAMIGVELNPCPAEPGYTLPLQTV